MTNSQTGQQAKIKIAIIGAGKVGQSLKQLFELNQHQVTLIGRDIAAYKNQINQAQLVLITTTDSQIKAVCDSISPYLQASTVVSHCSGALNSNVLNSAQQKGCNTASSHPLNTFPSLDAALTTFANTEHGTYLYCEGDKAALELITTVFKPSGFAVVEIDSKAKTAYHTACVFACNYLTVLMDLSLQTAELKGIDKTLFSTAIQPLIQATLSNINTHGTTASLSGPIARGDSTTVNQHIDLLEKESPTIANAYVLLAQHALQLAEQQGQLSHTKLEQLESILKPSEPKDRPIKHIT